MTKTMLRAELLQTKALRIDEHHHFISDTHFGHAGMMRMCARPFESVAEMDRHMIEQWNSVVQPGDEVWHLGDFAYRGDADHAEKIFKQLHGRKHLIIGNHDDETTLELDWASVQHRKILQHGGTKIILDHYPLREWLHFHNDSIHLFGHVHSNIPSSTRALDVGVDHVGFAPLNINGVREWLARQQTRDFRGLSWQEEQDELAKLTPEQGEF
ncbi:phosphohydrolase [Pelagibacterium halotolerans]|uniref:Phosphohydrolase (MutT/nudix family protein) n=1 Tax=Pelagibacterium halotolerans (strain DSM 22347 / JCM 15775 / CGMCC 1.7692 / B2) TaxID=1082931 RepID=G4RBI6_PELHB|nr:phosphohydrolase [Pelagibacterium halotolerans]AEQ52662.1 phosphohydrolase (MutT/nudix family protein) [Pelagibacterium halotolerans B2]QJR17636.1 metallophosphoesterase [Pelagibacterium halotolerans]SEA84016.1 Calcineurin-like phosphoesterase superfamily protein [Pelagibacterium halotolerans]